MRVQGKGGADDGMREGLGVDGRYPNHHPGWAAFMAGKRESGAT